MLNARTRGATENFPPEIPALRALWRYRACSRNSFNLLALHVKTPEEEIVERQPGGHRADKSTGFDLQSC
jgi:hypothetical protein